MINCQPPAIEPVSPRTLSLTKRFQVPLGLMPAKVDNRAIYGPAGAGAGRTREGKLTGGFVPEVRESVGTGVSESSKTRRRLLAAATPPAPDMSMAELVPLGPTTRISRLLGELAVRPCRTTSTLNALPFKPETEIADGYGRLLAFVALPVMSIA